MMRIHIDQDSIVIAREFAKVSTTLGRSMIAAAAASYDAAPVAPLDSTGPIIGGAKASWPPAEPAAVAFWSQPRPCQSKDIRLGRQFGIAALPAVPLDEVPVKKMPVQPGKGPWAGFAGTRGSGSAALGDIRSGSRIIGGKGPSSAGDNAAPRYSTGGRYSGYKFLIGDLPRYPVTTSNNLWEALLADIRVYSPCRDPH